MIVYIENIVKYNYNEVMKRYFKKLRPTLLSALLIALVSGTLFGFFSCSRAEPKIIYGFIELVYYPGSDQVEERYSFFILPEDNDGIENLSELYLYHDREGLRWLIGSEDWLEHEEDGRTWIGTRNLAMSGGGPMPRGQYRAVLVNKGGEKTERNFTYDSPIESPHPFPVFSVNNGIYSIVSGYPMNRLICYDQQGTVVHMLTVTENEGNIRDLRLASNIRSAALWAEDPEYQISALTEAALIR